MPLLSIPQLRSGLVRDFGCGNLTAFRNMVRITTQAGIRALCMAPVNETEPHLASHFSRSSNNALSHRIIALNEVPEIAHTPKIKERLDWTLDLHSSTVAGEKMNIPRVEMEHPAFLMQAYDVFLESSKRSERRKDMEAFCEEQGWWLKPYSAFNVMKSFFYPIPMEKWDISYADLSSSKSKSLFGKIQAKYLRGFFEYSQFEIHRQLADSLKYAHDMGIEEIELLMGVGVSRISAEAFLMGDIYDRFRQIGCLPEPENGYPLQLWGFPAERSNNPAALEFKVRSLRHMQQLGFDRISLDHAAGLLGGYFTFPVYDADSISSGEFRLLRANILDNEKQALQGCKWDCDGMDPNDHAYRTLFSILEQVPGMRLSAETVGDKTRRKAAEEAIRQAIEKGYDITLMEPLPWWNNETTPTLNHYSSQDRLSLTHDMPALTALLTGRVGNHEYPWINGESVSGLLQRFGVLSPQVTKPLDISELTPEFMYELMKRIICGSSAGTVSIPLTTLLTMKIEFLDGGKWMCINIQPGTEGVVNELENYVGNFLQRMPAIENLRGMEPQIGVLAARESEYCYPPFDIYPAKPVDGFSCQARRAGSSVAYQAKDGKWTVWTPPRGLYPWAEISFAYSGGVFGPYEDKTWATYKLNRFDLDSSTRYWLFDLLGNGQDISAFGWELKGNGISIGLNPTCNRHHFILTYADKQ